MSAVLVILEWQLLHSVDGSVSIAVNAGVSWCLTPGTGLSNQVLGLLAPLLVASGFSIVSVIVLALILGYLTSLLTSLSLVVKCRCDNPLYSTLALAVIFGSYTIPFTEQ